MPRTALFLIAGSLLLAAPCAAQASDSAQSHRPTMRVTWEEAGGDDSQWVGKTEWNCTHSERPAGWVNVTRVLSPLVRAFAAHEVQHITDFGRWPDCFAMLEAFKADPVGLTIWMESRAFCAFAKEAVAIGASPNLTDATRDAGVWLSTAYGELGLNEYQAITAIREADGCAVPPPTTVR